MDIAHQRLANQQLIQSTRKTPAEVVGAMGAMQAQDYLMALWAVGLRIPNATESDIEKAYNQGAILRTHIMRPTWHFVIPENIRWMQALTAPQVHAMNAHMYRKLELDAPLFARCHTIIIHALAGNNSLTREALGTLLENEGITARGQRLAYIIMQAELEGVICSGARQGKQFTYALLEERVPPTSPLDFDEALANLALLYFQSHAPAQVKDFAWWSGFNLKTAQKGVAMVESNLQQATIDGKTYYFVEEAKVVPPKPAFLVSIYDEYVIAYKDRSAINSKAGYIEKLLQMGNALTTVIILDGGVVGTWKRTLVKNKVVVKLNLFRALNRMEEQALDEAVHHYGAFLERPVEIEILIQ